MPGVLGSEASSVDESYTSGLLEYPQYTRPPVFRGHAVPEPLLSGAHAAVDAWRRRQALSRTLAWRPDQMDDSAWDECERLGLLETEGPPGHG